MYSNYWPISDEYGAFGNCRSLKEIVIPEGIEEIEEGTFFGCSSLESVTIPSTVKKIAHHAFAGCKSLKTINLPDSLVEIGDFAFEGCESLIAINIPQSCTIGKGTFWACKSLAKGKNPKTIKVCGRELDYYGTDVVAEFSGSVPRNYFSGFTSLRSVEIKGAVTDIKAGAFAGCINLKSIKWPKDLIVIGERASQSIGDYHTVFEDCHALEKLDIPEGVLHVYGIGNAFKEVIWPSTIYSMGYVGERIQRHTIKSDNYLPEIWKTESIINYGYWYSGILPLNYRRQYSHPIDIYVKAHLVPEYEAGMQKAIDCRAVVPEVRDMVRFHAIEE
ncbi:MAG: leucine-rich repeat domain-containing protein [Bacteroidales bacterium]|nr:leucine-rich repeat domain-containing protein [Bacteroidales bacterium]